MCVGLTHRSRRCLDSKCVCFCCHVTSGVGLVACNWWPGGLWPGTPLPTCCILLVNWSQTGYPFTDYLITVHWLCEQFNTAANASRTVHHHMSEGCTMFLFFFWFYHCDNPSCRTRMLYDAIHHLAPLGQPLEQRKTAEGVTSTLGQPLERPRVSVTDPLSSK